MEKKYHLTEEDKKYGPFTVEVDFNNPDIRHRFHVGRFVDYLQMTQEGALQPVDLSEDRKSYPNWKLVCLIQSRERAYDECDKLRQLILENYKAKYGEPCCPMLCGKEHIPKSEGD